MAAGKTLEELQAAGVAQEWSGWSWGFISAERWIATLHRGAGGVSGQRQVPGRTKLAGADPSSSRRSRVKSGQFNAELLAQGPRSSVHRLQRYRGIGRVEQSVSHSHLTLPTLHRGGRLSGPARISGSACSAGSRRPSPAARRMK